jgi:hypothetical protein
MDYTITLSRGNADRMGATVLLSETYPGDKPVGDAVMAFHAAMFAKKIVWGLDMALHIDDPRND